MLSENPEDVVLEALAELRQAEISLVELLASLNRGRDEHRCQQQPGGAVVVYRKNRLRGAGSDQLPPKAPEKKG